MAERIARAAIAYEQQATARDPASVTAILSDSVVVLMLHGVLSPGEEVLTRNHPGAAQIREFCRQLFAASSDALRQEVERISGVAVHEATAVLATETNVEVQVFLFAGKLPDERWTGVRDGALGVRSERRGPEGTPLLWQSR